MSHCAVQGLARCIAARTCRVGAIAGVFWSAFCALGVETATEDSQYLVDFWSTENGLPSNTISDLAQTPDGYLWASTYDGLVRFDGVRFVRVAPTDSFPSGTSNQKSVIRQASLLITDH